MSFLEFPGARLYYEIRGSGPLLLMVPGANGDADVFTGVAEHLAEHHTVITYDRRGFTRSQLDSPPQDEHRLATDADDAQRLIKHLDHGPATVFGTSSGAVLSWNCLLVTLRSSARSCRTNRQPYGSCPMGRSGWTSLTNCTGFTAKPGSSQHSHGFASRCSQHQTASSWPMRQATNSSEHVLTNAAYWFEHELRQYASVTLDLDALTAHAEKIVPAAGRESRGYPAYEVAVQLGRQLGRDLLELPGGHAGFASQPGEFAREFAPVAGPTGHAPTP